MSIASVGGAGQDLQRRFPANQAGQSLAGATKSADASGALDRALFSRHRQGHGATLLPHGTPLPCTACDGTGQARPLPRLAVTRHVRQMIRTCWELGRLPEFAALKLWKWAHMLGLRGHFSTNSRSCSTNCGLPVPSAQDSLAPYLTYWLENVAVHQLRETTHTRYTACVTHYLIPGLGKKKLTKLTAKDIRTWLNQLRTTCQCCTHGIDARRDQPHCCATGQCCRKLLSPLTLTYIHSVLKSALEHAVREEEIPRNAARNVRTGTPCPRRCEPLTTGEARQLLSTTHGHRLHALFEPALHTGLRKGELLGLRWEDLNLDTGTAAIRRTLQRTSTGGLTTLPTKTRASERRVALSPRCLHSLKQHHEQQQCERKAAGTAWRQNRYVFTTPQGRAIDPTNLTRTFTMLLHEAGLRRIRFHDLRHSTATLLLEQGVELVVIKELLGHAHIGVTATVYAHVRLRLQRDASNTLSTALDGPVGHDSTPDDGNDSPLCGAHIR